MSRNETLGAIIERFDLSAKSFCEETDGLYCEITSEYKGNETVENLKYRFADIYYNSFAVKFVYIARSSGIGNKNVLCCCVRFDKNDELKEIPLALLTDYIGKDINAPMCVPLIYNETAMEQAFDCVGGVVKDLLGDFKAIGDAPEKSGYVWSAFTGELETLLGDKYSDEAFAAYKNHMFYTFFPLRFCSDAFVSAVKGDIARAEKQLKKIKVLTGYEKRVITMLSVGETFDTESLPEMTRNLCTNYNSLGVEKLNKKEFLAMLISWFVLNVPFSGVFIGLYSLLAHFETANSEFVLASQDCIFYCVVFAFITAIALSYFTRKKFFKLVDRKHYETYAEQTDIQNGAGSDKFMKALLFVIFVACVIGCGLISKWNLNFMYDGFVDNSSFWSLKGEYYSYSEIEKVYSDDSVNKNLPYYIIRLKSGDEIYVSKLNYTEDTDRALDFLEEKGVTVERSRNE